MFRPDGDTETIYRPGAVAPRSGLYWTSHLRHRLAHVVFVEEGTKFPVCKHCGSGVRFHLQLRAHHIESDPSFARRSKVVAMEPRTSEAGDSVSKRKNGPAQSSKRRTK